MKVATFNINNINKRLVNLLGWLRAAKPDVVCLQELKATDREFPQAAIAKAGYGAVWRGQKSWNGVAILARGAEPIVTRRELPGAPDDEQARYIEAAVNGVLIASLYAPNGNPQPGPKFSYKLAWMDRLSRARRRSVWRPTCRWCSPAISTWCRPIATSTRPSRMTRMRCCNRRPAPVTRVCWVRVGAMRCATLHPQEPAYSYWSYLRNRWPRDAGLRIDHLLLEQAGRRTPGRRRRRPRRARRGQCQRSRAGLDRIAG